VGLGWHPKRFGALLPKDGCGLLDCGSQDADVCARPSNFAGYLPNEHQAFCIILHPSKCRVISMKDGRLVRSQMSIIKLFPVQMVLGIIQVLKVL